jgi:hypothetical protein
MQNMLLDLDSLDEGDASALRKRMLGQTNSIELNRTYASHIGSCKDPEITNSVRLVSTDGLYRDAWGTPLNFTSTNGGVFPRLNPELNQTKMSPFVIWSSGPNRVDDLGFADDVFLHR